MLLSLRSGAQEASATPPTAAPTGTPAAGADSGELELSAPTTPEAPAEKVEKTEKTEKTDKTEPVENAEKAEKAEKETAPAPTPAATPVAAKPESRKTTTRLQLKTARDDEYTKPLYFDSMDNLLPTMDLEYDMTAENGRSLKIGDVLFNDRTFFFALVPIAKFHPKMFSVVGATDAAKTQLVIRWPDPLFESGTLEMISRTGSVLWKEEITPEKRARWKEKLAIWKKGLEERGVKVNHLPDTSVFSTQYGMDIEGLKTVNESFRFCLSQTQRRSHSRLCSARYVLNGKNMAKVKSESSPRVLLQRDAAPLKQNTPVSMEDPTSFFAELGSGLTYEFVAKPNKINLMDLSDTKKPDTLRVVGWGTRPSGPSNLLNPDEYSSFTRLIGFESTIGDLRKFWETFISTEDAKVCLPGQGGGIFTQRFELSEVPRAAARPYLRYNTPIGTYVDGVKLYGRKMPEVKITSVENFVAMDDEDPHYFKWYFKATETGKMNRSYLLMDYQGKQYKAFYEVYRGLPNELSVRLSGLLSQTGDVFLGEVAYNHWFENIFGWTNEVLARQRWGVSVKMFKSLTDLKVSTAGDTASFSTMNVDLKYRLVQGLWDRDETLGAMLDYQKVTFGAINAPMLGVGAFWARSMPKVFDDLFNLMPLLRYSKWVDMEFIYYPSSLDSNVALGNNFALNFHGKVLWTKNFFGEAGFGIKRYDIVENVLQQEAKLSTFYGTVGVGISF